MSDTTPVDLDGIRERLDATTPAPWVAASSNKRKDGIALVGAKADVGTGKAIAVLAGDGRYRHADAEFIAHARDDIRSLLALVDRLRGNQQPDGGEWDVMYRRETHNADGTVYIHPWHSSRHEADTHEKRTWTGPIQPITETDTP